MYDTTKTIETEQSGLTFIQPGIHENVRLAKPDESYPIIYEKSKNGNEFIALHFMNNEGQTFVHTEWKPVLGTGEQAEAILEKKQANLVKRLLHIGKKIVNESALKFKVDTFEELAKLYIKAIGDNYKDKLFRVKIIYNNKNYTTFPNYVPFIESMSIKNTNLKMSPDDKVAKTKADTIPTTNNPFNEESEAETIKVETTSLNDLPWN